MKIQKLAAAACSCGRKHQIPIREIEIAPNLLSHLYQKLAGLGSWDKLLLVADENTWSAAGAQVEEALASGMLYEKVILSAGFKPDEESVDAILSSSAHRPDLLGSWLRHDHGSRALRCCKHIEDSICFHPHSPPWMATLPQFQP